MLATLLAASVSFGENNNYPVQTVSYTTGSQGARLTWLPYRPNATSVRHHSEASSVSTAQFEAPAPDAPIADDPLSDPFGDRSSRQRSMATQPSGTPEPVEAPEAMPVLPNIEADTADAPTDGAPKSLPQLWMEKESNKQGNAPGILSPNGPGVPSLEEELATNAQRREEPCPTSAEFKPIRDISNQITAEEGNFPPECPLESGDFQPRAWSTTTFAWTAAGLCHKPLYFEDVQLERYGHSWGPYLQPVISQGHFFLTVPILPYMMGLNPPNECLYSLGYYRPGSCAPYMLDPLPISVRAGLWEAGAWIGGAALVP